MRTQLIKAFYSIYFLLASCIVFLNSAVFAIIFQPSWPTLGLVNINKHTLLEFIHIILSVNEFAFQFKF